jgi:hypothetical protein
VLTLQVQYTYNLRQVRFDIVSVGITRKIWELAAFFLRDSVPRFFDSVIFFIKQLLLVLDRPVIKHSSTLLSAHKQHQGID